MSDIIAAMKARKNLSAEIKISFQIDDNPTIPVTVNRLPGHVLRSITNKALVESKQDPTAFGIAQGEHMWERLKKNITKVEIDGFSPEEALESFIAEIDGNMNYLTHFVTGYLEGLAADEEAAKKKAISDEAS